MYDKVENVLDGQNNFIKMALNFLIHRVQTFSMILHMICCLIQVFCQIVCYLVEHFLQMVYYLAEMFCEIAFP